MSQAPFPGLTGDQARLLRADENEGCSQENSKSASPTAPPPPPPATTPLSCFVVRGDSSGAKRLGVAGGSASKRRALADLGNVPHPVGQHKSDKVRKDPTSPFAAAPDSHSPSSPPMQVCAPPQVGPFPLTGTIWSSDVPPTFRPAALLQPREGPLWGELHPLSPLLAPSPLCAAPNLTPLPHRHGLPLVPVSLPWGRGRVH